MRTRWPLSSVGIAVAAVVAAACTAAPAEPKPWIPAVEAEPAALVAFDSCAHALRELTAAALPHVSAYGLGGSWMLDGARAADAAPGLPAPQRRDQEHSSTNVHEAGVDEPDLVKTDGRRLVTVADGTLRVVDLAGRRITATLDLRLGPATDLLLHGDRALVVVPHGDPVKPLAPVVASPVPLGTARLVLVDLAGARVLETLTVDGRYVDARQVAGVTRVVVRSAPRLRFVHPQDRRSEATARNRNRQIVVSSTIDDWLPRYELARGATREQGRLLECGRLSRPATYSGASMLSVLTFDLSAGLDRGDPVGVMGDGQTVYGTADSLYVADNAHRRWEPADGGIQRTEVHQFDVAGAEPPRYLASGEVEGWLLNQYSLSEHAAHLRVATTYLRNGRTASAVTVLARQGQRLVRVGQVGGLGRGDRIYAVRFLGPTGYVVTFRQVDPLYVLDLSDPAHPRAAGELKISGYSAYLHPVGDGTLIGVGQEATTEGRAVGTQVSLFDVTDPALPRRVARHHLRHAQSEVDFDPHAFLHWPASGLVVVPVMGSVAPRGGALVLRLGDGAFTSLGLVEHPRNGYRQTSIRRALVVGDALWTVSPAGAMATATDRRGLPTAAWVPFR